MQVASIIQSIGTVQLSILGRTVMGIRFSGMLLAVVTTTFVIAPGLSALAQFNLPSVGGPNTSDRMGGGGGAKGSTQRTKNLNSSRSNVNRMGGGGGAKGAVQLNPQPEPPGKTK
jgi:hypothetical protein